MEKSEVRAVLELAKQMFMEDAAKSVAGAEPEAVRVPCGKNRGNNQQNQECDAPFLVLYFVFTDCVTINNGACPQWEFCRQGLVANGAR